MKKLLNTLYVTTENAYISLDGENVVVQVNGSILGRLPIHTIDSIVAFGYIGASPALMGKCSELNKSLVFLKPSGKFLAKVTGKSYGNILLRREQYRICDDKDRSFRIAKNIISAKIINSRSVVNRTLRDHTMRINQEKFESVSEQLKKCSGFAYECSSADELRGIEGECANGYFSVFDDMILQQKDDFCYKSRSRRPPMDNVNAMLSFAYSLLTSMCVSALETVGLDPYAGFFHTERPGRCSLALDLVEEFRAAFADRFVLTMINRRLISPNSFVKKENGGIILKDEYRKSFLSAWQSRKRETLTHPFLKEKVEWGMLPYVQAMLLARYVRGDIDEYPPFIWK
ncbi:MAG: type I-C CRISPR-associated endonuclease Cas1c [Ruminococcus sp.]|nr:type I-C CRISPR-associated endonuclease Cas1c [Ruminococcus sp.]